MKRLLTVIFILVSSIPAQSVGQFNGPDKAALVELGYQLTELYLRGYRWPQRKHNESCWHREALPNVIFDFHNFEATDNPPVTAHLLKLQKQNVLLVDDYKIITKGVTLKKDVLDLIAEENNHFIYQFVIELPGDNNKKKFIGCREVDKDDVVKSCLQPSVVSSEREAYTFEISGDVVLPQTDVQIRQLASESKPPWLAVLGLYEPERFNIIKSQCFFDSI